MPESDVFTIDHILPPGVNARLYRIGSMESSRIVFKIKEGNLSDMAYVFDRMAYHVREAAKKGAPNDD